MKKLTSKFVIPECPPICQIGEISPRCFIGADFYRESRHAHNSAFTLIEIIVVLIIVGILTAIALPNLFSNVSQSRAAEALGVIGSYRPTMEACITQQAGVSDTACNSANLGLPSQSANFSYSVTGPQNATTTDYSIVANGINALGTGDTITISRTAATFPNTNPITCVGGGRLLGAC